MCEVLESVRQGARTRMPVYEGRSRPHGPDERAQPITHKLLKRASPPQG